MPGKLPEGWRETGTEPYPRFEKERGGVACVIYRLFDRWWWIRDGEGCSVPNMSPEESFAALNEKYPVREDPDHD